MIDRPTGPCHRVWVVADLQYPALAERCLSVAIDDLEQLAVDIDAIWYLGDAATSRFDGDPTASPEVRLLEQLDQPLRFVMGNHDVERICVDGGQSVPMHDVVTANPDWRTTPSLDSFYFLDRLGPFDVLFLSDHVAPDGSWCVHHGEHRHGDPDAYPYSTADYRAVIDELAVRDRPLITAAHTSFPGGNRASSLQGRLLPLPDSVRLHLYGHAHIGDRDHLRNPYQTISYVQDQPIPQIDVASLEDRRDGLIRSVFLEAYDDGSCVVSFRDHTNGRWLESYHRPGP